MAKVIPLVMHAYIAYIIILYSPKHTNGAVSKGSDYKLILGDTHKMESESEV